MKTHDCISELRKSNLKATPARLGILAALELADKPIDIQTIARYLQKHTIPTDKVTIFRNANILVQKNLIKPIQLNEGKLRYEYAGKSEHHHFICEQCGAIEDILGCGLDTLEKEISKKKGVLIKRHSLEFFGLCANCQK